MKKNVIIVSSTPRKGGNSEILVDEFMKGALESGHNVEKISLRDFDLKFCIGCFYCQTHDGCVLSDGINAILPRVQNADVLVFATPIYYYEMTGQLKTFLDRMNPLFAKSYNFKSVYLLTTSADRQKSSMDAAILGVQGWIRCFQGVTLDGIIYGVNAEAIGDILSTDAPQKAYKMGKSIK